MCQDIAKIAEKINKAGGKLYLVGGAIRDRLLGLKITDADYAVVGLDDKEFSKMFPNAITRGKSFPVYIINNSEFALARREEKIGRGHKQFKIYTGKDVTIEEELKRRDITINSIAEDVLTKEIIDPFNRY